MTSPARDAALDVMLAVHQRGAYANLALDAKLSQLPLSRRDAALATELAYGSLRAEGTLDWAIDHFSARGRDDLSSIVLDALRLAAYQILYLDVPDHASVNEAVNQVRTRENRGAAAYVNAVLRALTRGRGQLQWPSLDEDSEAHASICLWHPRWLVRKWFEELGAEETVRLCEADNVAPAVSLRVNALRTSREAILEKLSGRGIDAEPGEWMTEAIRLRRAGVLSELAEHTAGMVHAQDEASMAVAHVLDPQPGETVADLCAAPGGKATHVAELMCDRGEVIAVDINAARLGLVRQATERLGIGAVRTVEADATEWRPSEPVGKVLLDAPCSGLGVLARRAEARWKRKSETIRELARLQASLLDNAAGMVKPGGRLVYSTCTISKAENQDQVEAFRLRHPEFKPRDPAKDLGIAAPSGPGWMQFLPHLHGTDGIFVAALERVSLASGRELPTAGRQESAVE